MYLVGDMCQNYGFYIVMFYWGSVMQQFSLRKESNGIYRIDFLWIEHSEIVSETEALLKDVLNSKLLSNDKLWWGEMIMKP